MARKAGREAVLEMLHAEGVRYIFGNPGSSEAPLLETSAGFPDMRYVLALQEGVAVGMADGLARATGQPAFVCLHRDTGLANGISLLINAAAGGTPLVLCSVNTDIRKLAEDRADLVRMVGQFTKWSAEVTRPEQIPGALRRAFLEARTPPTGPTYLSFAFNVLDEMADLEIVPSPAPYVRQAPDPRAISDAVEALLQAPAPILLVGDRVAQAGAAAEAVELAEVLGARVYAAHFSEVNFPTGHPQFLGPMSQFVPATRRSLSSAGAVLAVGTSVFGGFSYLPGMGLEAPARLLHLDSSFREVGKCEPTDIGIVADIRMGLAELTRALKARMSPADREQAWTRARLAEEERQRQRAPPLEPEREGRPMSARRMVAEIARVLPAGTIVVDDAGTASGALHAEMTFDAPGSLFGARGGAIGWGLGGALGVKLALRELPVVAFVGEGSAMMTAQALWTAAQERLAVLYVICNNQSYRTLKLNLDKYNKQLHGPPGGRSRYVGMDFPSPLDLAGIAAAMGVRSRRILEPAGLAPAVREALSLEEPTLLDVLVDGDR